eukprot:m51a1_g10158 putative protein kinase domain containing protein (810) ;mRNA; f:23501-26249
MRLPSSSSSRAGPGQRPAAPVLAVALLALATAAASGASDYGETCATAAGSEFYDSATSVYNMQPSAPACSDSSPDDAGGSTEVVQLFAPRSLPWNYTTVCWKALFGEQGTVVSGETVYATLVAYTNAGGLPGAQVFSRTVALSAITRVRGGSPQYWYSASAGVVAAAQTLFLGVRLAGTCAKRTSFYASLYQNLPRRAAWRRGPEDPWSTWEADWAGDNVTSVLVRAVGRPALVVPAGWTCAPGRYRDGVACDCGCGLWDPDCNASVAGAVSRDCNASANEVCDRAGRCRAVDWDTRVAGCALRSWGSGDGCQCGCGASLDPDCRWQTIPGPWRPRATNCAGLNVASCGDAGQCVEAWPDAARCPAVAYADGALCDCSCQTGGVADPDCASGSFLPVNVNRSSCGADGHCYLGACRPYPPAWKCTPDRYGAGDGCNCECGAPDPDCAIQTGAANPAGCGNSWSRAATFACSAASKCVASGCGNGVVETLSEQCEGGLSCSGCRCAAGWTSTSPPSANCTPECGDGRAVGGEECDGGAFCEGCRCRANHTPMAPAQAYCSGCGNGVAEAGEECDGGGGCLDTCRCVGGFAPTSPATTSCVAVDNDGGGGGNGALAVIIAAPVAGGTALLVFGGLAAAAVVALHRRKLRAPNLPIDMRSLEFIPAGEHPATIDASHSDALSSAMPLPFIYPPATTTGDSSGSSSIMQVTPPRDSPDEGGAADFSNVVGPVGPAAVAGNFQLQLTVPPLVAQRRPSRVASSEIKATCSPSPVYSSSAQSQSHSSHSEDLYALPPPVPAPAPVQQQSGGAADK